MVKPAPEPLAAEPLVNLRTADLAAILDAAEAVDRAMPADVAINDILGALSALVSCDLLFWTRFDVHTPHKIAEVGYPHAPRAAPVDDWIAHRHEHPICSGRHGPVVAVSDIITPSQLHHTWLYQMCWRQAGWEHEIGINLTHPNGEIHDIVISRGPGHDFTDRDHLILRLLRPHLDTALQRLAYPAPRLTPREVQVLRHVRDGMPNQHIAHTLHIAESTVIKHLEHIYARSGAHSRTQAVQLCSSALD